MRTNLIVPATLACLSVTAAVSANEDRTAAELLPASTVAYAEIPRPGQLLDTVLEHPIYARVKELDQYQQAIQAPQYLQFLAIVGAIEAQIGMTWREAYDTSLGGGIYAGLDSATQGVAILFRASDADELKKVTDTLIQLAKDDAERKGRTGPRELGEYRGFTAYAGQDKKSRFAVVGPWLLMTNKEELGKSLIDRYLDDGDESLSATEPYQAARSQRSGTPTFWTWVNTGTIRDAGLAPKLFAGRSENPGVELLVGGILSNIRQTPYVTASIDLSTGASQLELSAPHDASWVEEAREFFFGPDGKGRAPSPISTSDTIMSLSTYRKISEMWLRAGDLFDEKMNDELAQADANLSTLFAGRDFGEDILGSFGPELQLVVNRQDFADRLPQPAIRIPSFAIVGNLVNPDEMRAELRRTFQSMIGFLNVIGAMEGNPQLDMQMEKIGESPIITTAFIAEQDERDSKQARIHFNFSPSIAFVGDQFVLSSTEGLARELVDVVSKGKQAPQAGADANVNSLIEIDMRVLREILNDNRSQLIAQNMLEEGHTKEEAETQIGIFLSALESFGTVKLQLTNSDDQLGLRLSIQTAQAGAIR